MAEISRLVDAHVHLWDPANTEWYPYLSGQQDVGIADVKGMARRFEPENLRQESARWPLEKYVNVAAATGENSIQETLALQALAERGDGPDGIVGGLLPRERLDDSIGLLDEQLAASRLRGVRSMGSLVGQVPPPELLQALADRDLVFDLMAHPDALRDAADAFAQVPELAVVVEHTGWPRNDSAEEARLWTEGMTALADVGEQVTCKLSGLAMPMGSMSVDAFRPWMEKAIELFGAGRCMFASNFPVDGMHGTYDELFQTYTTLTAGLDASDVEKLYATTAERVYRL